MPLPHRREFVAVAGAAGAGLLAARAAAADPPLAPPNQESPDAKMPEKAERTVGWAVVGLGKLALEEVMPAFAACKLSRPVALVTGHPEKAKKVAAVYGLDPQKIYTYDTYDRLADDPAVQVVYNILPNHMHEEYTVRALKAGKHVLCEKPMAPTAAACERMIAAGKQAGRQLMIAYRLHYEPFNRTATELCRKGEVGAIRSITASNCQVTQAPNIRLSKATAGGPVGDIGIYCLNAARYLTGEEPAEVTAVEYQPKDNPRFREVPATVSFTLRFPSGAVAACDCSFDAAESRRFRVQGTDGFLDLEKAFAYRGQELMLAKGGKQSKLELRPVDHFAAEMDHFSGCVLTGKPNRTPGEEGLADLRVIEAIYEAAASGRVVTVKKAQG